MQKRNEDRGGDVRETRPDATQSPTGEKPSDADEQVPKSDSGSADAASTSREQLVREAAYRRFESRGAEHGRDEEDWLEAEKEVRPPEGN
jgi:Protein of unknown function (DUF2934)